MYGLRRGLLNLPILYIANIDRSTPAISLLSGEPWGLGIGR